MPLFSTSSSSSSFSKSPIPYSTVQAKRDDDFQIKKKRSNMQSSFINNRNTRILVAVGILVTVAFWLFSSTAPVTTTGASGIANNNAPAQPKQQSPQHEQKQPDHQQNEQKESSGASSLSCTTSFDGKRPVTQYVVMIDAGSSGSRVHVYEFNNCQATPQLVREEFKMMEPGLSSFDEDAEGAAKSLDQLLDLAVEHVPKEFQSCTPVAVKATAGLRILGDEKSEKILSAVKTRLETKYPFPVVEKDGVAIMDGKDEGVYAWITANYLLGNIGSSEKTPTAAVFDLGGGSTQIVFEPTFNVPSKSMSEGDHKYTLDFGGRHFELYQHSHLGYGLNEARKKINSLIAANSLKDEKEPKNGATVTNPCLPPDSSIPEVEVDIAPPGSKEKKELTVKMVGPKQASVAQCRKLAEQILNKEAECSMEPCSFNGIHQPSFMDSFMTNSDMYIFSFFYDKTFPLGMPSSFSLDELKDLTNKVCHGAEYYDSFTAIEGAVDQLKKNPSWCLELNFMTAILHTGYDIPIHREVKIAKKIKNNELGWCLGASLPLLDMEGWSCKVRDHQ